MTQTNYKKIAETIKSVRDSYPAWAVAIDLISKKLADHFEKEDKKYCLECCEANVIHSDYWKRYSLFNRPQFLKWAGVKK